MRAIKLRQNPKLQLKNKQNKNITQIATADNIPGKLTINQPKVELPKSKFESLKVEPPKTKVEPPNIGLLK